LAQPRAPFWSFACRRRSATALLAVFPLACGVEPLPEVCPAIAEGELVITELRGAQTGTDTWGQWIELYNGSGRTLELTGLQVRLFGVTEDEQEFFVRDRALQIAPGGYVVLGQFDLGMEPAHVDYGFRGDVPDALIPRGSVTLRSCDLDIDRVVYVDAELPSTGTWALDGAIAPTAAANDDPAAFCVDATPQSPDGPMVEVGVPGTPGEVNRPCP
jgi:hypothetical protein